MVDEEVQGVVVPGDLGVGARGVAGGAGAAAVHAGWGAGAALPVAADVERRAGDPAVLIASSEKAVTELGWQPQRTTIDEIVSDAWEFTRSRV